MLGTKEGRKLTKYVHDYVVYDLETTGISSDNDSIVEIGAVRVRDGQVVDEYKIFVNPECHIPAEVSNINGITDDMVKDAPVMADVLPDFMDFIGDDILVGHNIRYFDNRFINRYAKELYR
jgi:DNA polymerase III epsilon subunit family exonuclease